MLAASHSAIAQLTLVNGQAEQTCFNVRLQPTGIRLGAGITPNCSNPGPDFLNLVYDYGSTNNNGNLLGQTITRQGQTWVQSYPPAAYDGVNRLTAPSEAGGWSHTYTYDNFGNRAVTAGNVPYPGLTPSAIAQYSNNRWYGTGVDYDPAGLSTAVRSHGIERRKDRFYGL